MSKIIDDRFRRLKALTTRGIGKAFQNEGIGSGYASLAIGRVLEQTSEWMTQSLSQDDGSLVPNGHFELFSGGIGRAPDNWSITENVTDVDLFVTGQASVVDGVTGRGAVRLDNTAGTSALVAVVESSGLVPVTGVGAYLSRILVDSSSAAATCKFAWRYYDFEGELIGTTLSPDRPTATLTPAGSFEYHEVITIPNKDSGSGVSPVIGTRYIRPLYIFSVPAGATVDVDQALFSRHPVTLRTYLNVIQDITASPSTWVRVDFDVQERDIYRTSNVAFGTSFFTPEVLVWSNATHQFVAPYPMTVQANWTIRLQDSRPIPADLAMSSLWLNGAIEGNTTATSLLPFSGSHLAFVSGSYMVKMNEGDTLEIRTQFVGGSGAGTVEVDPEDQDTWLTIHELKL